MLRVKGLSFSYGARAALRGIDLEVAGGSLCSILGNNGAGKSTLLKCVAGILRSDRGSISLGGEDRDNLNRREAARLLAYVPQREIYRARLTVFDAVLMGRRPHIGWGVRARDLEVAERVIEELELDELSLRFVDELSGGEYQKVVIARALAQEPRVLLLDEPTSNLDLRNQLEVMHTVRRAVGERGISVLMAIHDVNLAVRFSDVFLLMHDGAALAGGGREVIEAGNIERTYGVKVRVEERNGETIVTPVLDPPGEVTHGE
ncbi:MAG: ABC transporter ATP-binding protein [Spirochaetales bacterium]|nr:ABC transporter ATP-binding protein [Spirochaetales bacterium]